MRSAGSTPGLIPLLVITALGTPLLSTRPPQAREVAPTVLVHGAAQYNGHPSPAFQHRLDHAAHLYREGGVQRIIVTGGVGRGDTYSEGQVGLQYLARQGIPRRHLEAETTSHSTLENLTNSRPLIDGPVTLVTDAAHAPRALALARAVGLEANVSSVPLASNGEAADRYRAREKVLLAAYTLLGLPGDPRP